MLVVVTGTGTDVGKTWFAAATLRELRARGMTVAARKPVQSFEPGAPATDADVLAEATGEEPAAVCPPHRWIPVALAPPMAAEVLGRPAFTVGDLASELAPLPPADLVVVEGAGGPRSPLAADGDTVELARILAPDVVVVVGDAGLGTINSIRLCAGALCTHRLLVALNRFDPTDDLHRRNRDWLATREGLEVVTDPEALATRLVRLRG